MVVAPNNVLPRAHSALERVFILLEPVSSDILPFAGLRSREAECGCLARCRAVRRLTVLPSEPHSDTSLKMKLICYASELVLNKTSLPVELWGADTEHSRRVCGRCSMNKLVVARHWWESQAQLFCYSAPAC